MTAEQRNHPGLDHRMWMLDESHGIFSTERRMLSHSEPCNLIVKGIKTMKCVESLCIDHLVAAEQGQRH